MCRGRVCLRVGVGCRLMKGALLHSMQAGMGHVHCWIMKLLRVCHWLCALLTDKPWCVVAAAATPCCDPSAGRNAPARRYSVVQAVPAAGSTSPAARRCRLPARDSPDRHSSVQRGRHGVCAVRAAAGVSGPLRGPAAGAAASSAALPAQQQRGCDTPMCAACSYCTAQVGTAPGVVFCWVGVSNS